MGSSSSWQILLVLHVLLYTITDVHAAICEVDRLDHDGSRRTPTTLTFDWELWDTGQGGDSHCDDVEICINDAFPETCFNHTGHTAGTSTFTDLRPGSSYRALLWVSNTDDRYWSHSERADGKTPPVAPTDVSVALGMPPQLTLTVTWSQPLGDYDSVRVVCHGPGSGHNNFTVDHPQTTADCTDLNQGTEYTVTLTTLQTDEVPVSAPVVTGTTDILLPPSEVEVTEGTNPSYSILVSWKQPPNYHFQTCVVAQPYNGGPTSKYYAYNTVNSTYVYGLTPGQIYNVTLYTTAAQNREDMRSEVTDPVHTLTAPAIPEMHVTYQGPTSLTITVTPDGLCAEIRVYRLSLNSENPLEDWVTAPCPGDSTFDVRLSGMASNAEYSVTASAVSQSNSSLGLQPLVGGNITRRSWTLPEVLPPPVVLRQTSNWIVVGWENVTINPQNLQYYYLYVDGHAPECRLEIGPMTGLAPDCECRHGVITNPFNMTYIEEGTRYRFTVTAVNPGVCGLNSSQAVTWTEGADSIVWVAGVVMGVVGFIVLVTVLAVVCSRKHRKKAMPGSSDMHPERKDENELVPSGSQGLSPREDTVLAEKNPAYLEVSVVNGCDARHSSSLPEPPPYDSLY